MQLLAAARGFVWLRPDRHNLVAIVYQSPERRHGRFRSAHENDAHGYVRLCRLMCGKARPYRDELEYRKRGCASWIEAEPHINNLGGSERQSLYAHQAAKPRT